MTRPPSRTLADGCLTWWAKFFGNFFAPLVHIQNEQRVMGIILRYVCWGTHRPPPPLGSPALTARPADPQGLGQPRGGERSPPPYIPQNCRTTLGVTHWLAAAPVIGVDSVLALGTATLKGRCYVDWATPLLPDQIEEMGFVRRCLQGSHLSARRGGGLVHAMFGVSWVKVARSVVS